MNKTEEERKYVRRKKILIEARIRKKYLLKGKEMKVKRKKTR